MKMKISLIPLLTYLFLFIPGAVQSDQFSIVVIPDTQIYVEENPEIFEAQMQWIVDNEVAENIIYVSHLGDLKDDQSCDNKIINNGTGAGRTEWEIVDDTLAILEAANIPYGVVPGNHDFDPIGNNCPNWTTERPLATYNALIGPARFAAQPYYGDPGVPTPGNRVVGSNEDNFTLFESSGGVEFIAINLAYKEAANAMGMDAEVSWADALLKAYPDRLGILTSHYFLDENPGNSFAPYGQEIYDGLSNNPNLFMMLSAHKRGEAWRVETTGRVGMQPVQVLLSDYQSSGYPPVNFGNVPFCGSSCGDSGLMRIMRFDTDTGMVDIETFIPPVPFLGRMGTLVSNYFPVDGTGMDRDTASNISVSYLGYVPTPPETGVLVSCGSDTTGGDRIFRGFFHPSYPGTSLDTVELYISSRQSGNFTIRLDAMLNSYDGALIASNSQMRALSGVDTENVSYLFDMGGAAVPLGSTVAFRLTQESGPTDEVFYAVDSTEFILGVPDPTSSCDIDETTGTTAPLDTFRRDGVWVRINGLP